MDQCKVCKHIRYDEDLFDETCWACSQWAQEQITALKAKYEGPLTNDEVGRACALWDGMAEDVDDYDYANVRDWDTCIRQVRQERGKP